jgi:hypothetical protein
MSECPTTRAEARRYIAKLISKQQNYYDPEGAVKQAEKVAKRENVLSRGLLADAEYWRWALSAYGSKGLNYEDWMTEEALHQRMHAELNITGMFSMRGLVMGIPMTREGLEAEYIKLKSRELGFNLEEGEEF